MKTYSKKELENFSKKYLKKILKNQNAKLNHIWDYFCRGVATDKDDQLRDLILYNIEIIELELANRIYE